VSKTLYIGNLFFDVKEHDLEKEFSKAGRVVKTKIIYDQRGLSKGYVILHQPYSFIVKPLVNVSQVRLY